MKFDIRDRAAVKSCGATLILKDGRVVAKVISHFSDGGTSTLNVWQSGEPAKRSAALREFLVPSAVESVYRQPDDYGEGLTYQAARAGGYGYDKETAALAGMIIDGVEMTNHCAVRLPLPKGEPLFPLDFTPPAGYRPANYQRAGEGAFGADLPEGAAGYMSCYRESGLKVLEALGYTVERVL